MIDGRSTVLLVLVLSLAPLSAMHAHLPHPDTDAPNRLPPEVLALVAQRVVQSGLAGQRVPDLVHVLGRPALAAHLAQRVQQLVVRVHDHLLDAGRGAAHDDVHVLADLLAEGVEGQVVDVVAEGVLDLPPDQREA